MAEQQGPIVAWHARGDGAFETFLLLDQVLVGVNERRLENVFGDGGPDIAGQCHGFGCGRGCGHRLIGDGAQGGQGGSRGAETLQGGAAGERAWSCHTGNNDPQPIG